ncbi:Hydroxyproline O-galactosyltransferase GALT3 [Linum perenne]
MKLFNVAFSLFLMKKWSGGVVIVALAMIFICSYTLMSSSTQQPQKTHNDNKQSAYDFFRIHPSNNSLSKDDVNSTKVRPPPPQVSQISNKPALRNVQGLSDLYALNNVSKEESKAFLVWSQLRMLLSRSDALPETAQGIKEASIAWKELLPLIEEERAAKLVNSDKSKDKSCPYSVSTVDLQVPNTETILDIPCGLIEDSSVTLVGIPGGQNHSFQIELTGSQLQEETLPSVIMLYKVRIPGDNMTEGPFIVQNSWTRDGGWGNEERCPSHNSANSQKVDGLVICNEEVVRGTTEEIHNASHPGADAATNGSRESVHTDANLPFVEKNLVAATLWVGPEGFHMTVNGRHETSFAFREKLEPWSVSRVKVSGSFDILSAIAKGLPVPEDHDLVADIEHLKAPPSSTKRLIMLVGVFSTGNNFQRRMALRKTWMQYEVVRSGKVAVRFFIGLNKNTQVNFELWKEAQAYGDIQLMPFVDYYSLISLKTIAICIMGTKILPAKYIMKTDDDAFIRIDEVLTSLKEKQLKGLLYGLISFDSAPHRDKDSKWYISEEEWAHPAYPPWAHGPGYVISRDVAKFIVQGHQQRDLQLFKLEDVAMGIWIDKLKQKGEEVNYASDDRFHNAGCEPNYVLAHYQSPRLVLCLWEKLQKEHQPACCE